MHARKAVLYCKSRTPRLFNPVTPCAVPWPAPLASRCISALTPGRPSWDTSGTTMNVPVKTHLSPAFARSTSSPRKITSKLRGMEPVGISFGFSWMRTFCQSVNLLSSRDSFHCVRLPHSGFGHKFGSVYLNCCSTSDMMPPHSSQ